MALNKVKLESDIKALLTALSGYDGQDTKSQNAAIKKFAADLSMAIDTFVKSGEVTTTVTGTCPQGPVSGTGKGAML